MISAPLYCIFGDVILIYVETGTHTHSQHINTNDAVKDIICGGQSTVSTSDSTVVCCVL